MERVKKGTTITCSHTPQYHKVANPWNPTTLAVITWSSSQAAVVLPMITRSNARNGVLYWLKTQQVFWKSVQTSLSSGIRAVPGTTEQEATSKATVTPVSSNRQQNSRNNHYLLHIHYLLFCIFDALAMLAPPFQTPPHKHTKLPDVLNLQEQLRSFVGKCPMSHVLQLQECIICSVITPDGSHSGFPQAGTDASH